MKTHNAGRILKVLTKDRPKALLIHNQNTGEYFAVDKDDFIVNAKTGESAKINLRHVFTVTTRTEAKRKGIDVSGITRFK